MTNNEESASADQSAEFQAFLDSKQYAKNSILRYEKIFGAGYVSTGGQETTTEFVKKLNLKAGDRVLDVGCGIGGGDFYMAKEFGAKVVGIDLSKNMIELAQEASAKNSNLDVQFAVEDATTVEYDAESFDVIYSRDTILHIEDKKTLFSKFRTWLKPGGKILISDYCCGEQSPSDRFTTYVADRGYHLLSPKEYGSLLESVGFHDVVVEDRTSHFVSILQAELLRAKSQKEEFIKETSQEDYDAIETGWQAKIVRCNDGDQKWGLFYARK